MIPASSRVAAAGRGRARQDLVEAGVGIGLQQRQEPRRLGASELPKIGAPSAKPAINPRTAA